MPKRARRGRVPGNWAGRAPEAGCRRGPGTGSSGRLPRHTSESGSQLHFVFSLFSVRGRISPEIPPATGAERSEVRGQADVACRTVVKPGHSDPVCDTVAPRWSGEALRQGRG